ncbi:membrane protein [Streptomyces phage MeganTheeKilla]|uniref:Membrane protein n=1 Tax=Streptomyces phage MeganTheeKilla TaxID=2801897 RepID=A0A7U0GCA9_9CAUD|nr:membrane protein [Streptomyces phage MeganTheeKilla]
MVWVMTKKQHQDSLEEFVYGCVGFIMIIGMVCGAVIVGLTWLAFELFS